MHELDLIPESYRRAQRQRRWLVLFGVAAGVIVALTVTTSAGLSVLNSRVAADIEALQRQQTISAAERDELQRLLAQKADFQQQLRLLTGLRSGTAAENLFRIVDDVLVEDELWFLDWEFRRAGVSNDDTGRPVETGYFLVVPSEGGGSKEDTWRVETHMQISGQATDHAALSEFVKRLFGRPEIYDVRVKRTALHRYRTRTVVDFDLTVVINTRIAG